MRTNLFDYFYLVGYRSSKLFRLRISSDDLRGLVDAQELRALPWASFPKGQTWRRYTKAALWGEREGGARGGVGIRGGGYFDRKTKRPDDCFESVDQGMGAKTRKQVNVSKAV